MEDDQLGQRLLDTADIESSQDRIWNYYLGSPHTAAVITAPASASRVIVTTLPDRALGHEVSLAELSLAPLREALARPPTPEVPPTSKTVTTGAREEVAALVRLPALVRVVITLLVSVTDPGAGVCLLPAHPAPGAEVRGRDARGH